VKGIAMTRNIIITENDLERLLKLVAYENEFGKAKDSIEIQALEKELRRATVVDARDIPAHVVTMNSKFVVKDLDTEELIEYTLVYPEDADVFEDKISIMAPIGTAVLGYAVGDAFDWHVPDGVVKYRIEKIVFQPEASGNYDL
jgi:regulator of nucleoside diphosphate kinase